MGIFVSLDLFFIFIFFSVVCLLCLLCFFYFMNQDGQQTGSEGTGFSKKDKRSFAEMFLDGQTLI